MQREFVEYPALLSHWGARYADAIEAAAAAKERLKDVEAEVYLLLRDANAGTEATIKAKVRGDKRVQAARAMAAAAEARETRFHHKVMTPLYAKKEMLISLGAHQRAEVGGDPLLRRAHREDLARLERRAADQIEDD